MRKLAPRRNPIARALRTLRPKVRPSAKLYRRQLARKAALQLLIACCSMQSIPAAAQVQEACCGPSSMYAQGASTPREFQEDNATGRACCGLGSQYEIERARQEEWQQQQWDNDDERP